MSQAPDAQPFRLQGLPIEGRLHVDEAAATDQLVREILGRQLLESAVRYRGHDGVRTRQRVPATNYRGLSALTIWRTTAAGVNNRLDKPLQRLDTSVADSAPSSSLAACSASTSTD